MRRDLHFSSEKMDFQTPRALYAALDAVFRFELDAATSPDNPLGTPAFYAPPQDALTLPWARSTFLNPPYGRDIRRWIEKCATEAAKGNTVVALVAARTDTKWWLLCEQFGEVTYITGRIPFTLPGITLAAGEITTLGPDGKPARLQGAPFPSAVVVFRPRLPHRVSVRELLAFPQP